MDHSLSFTAVGNSDFFNFYSRQCQFLLFFFRQRHRCHNFQYFWQYFKIHRSTGIVYFYIWLKWKRIRIRQNDADQTGSGSRTLVSAVSLRSLLMLVPFFLFLNWRNLLLYHSIDKMINSEVLTTCIGSSSISPSHNVNSGPSTVSILLFYNILTCLTYWPCKYIWVHQDPEMKQIRVVTALPFVSMQTSVWWYSFRFKGLLFSKMSFCP